MNQVWSVCTGAVLHIEDIIRQIHPPVVVPQMVGIIAVRQQLAIIAEKRVASLVLGITRGADESQPPLAKGCGSVTRLLERMKKGARPSWQRVLSFRIQLDIAPDVSVAAVHSRQEAGTRRGTDRSPRIALREAHARLGQAVDMRRFKLLLTITAQVAIAQVVGQDEKHIGPVLCRHAQRTTQANP